MGNRWTWIGLSWLVLVAAATGCAQSREHRDAGRACELLQVERAFAAPAPAPATGEVDQSLQSLIVGDRMNSQVHGIVYVQPDQAEELDAVAEEVGLVSGIEVEAVVDQDATYEEFIELFAGQQQLVNAVVPTVLPPSVRVTADSDAALDELGRWADEDARVYEVVDIRAIADGTFAAIARRFDTELDELVAATGGDMRSALEAIRSASRHSLDDVVATYRAIEEFVADECA